MSENEKPFGGSGRNGRPDGSSASQSLSSRLPWRSIFRAGSGAGDSGTFVGVVPSLLADSRPSAIFRRVGITKFRFSVNKSEEMPVATNSPCSWAQTPSSSSFEESFKTSETTKASLLPAETSLTKHLSACSIIFCDDLYQC